MEIFLYRHGMTDGNAKRQYIGRTDEPLSPEGIRRLRDAGAQPAVQTVYVSPLLRTRQTADLLFPNAAQIAVQDLREMDFGVFERRSAREMAQDAEYTAWVNGGCLDRCPGGERRMEFSARTCAAFRGIVAEAIARGAQRLYIVAHGGTAMAVCSAFSDSGRDYFDWGAVTPNGGCWRLFADDAAWGEHPLLRIVEAPRPIPCGEPEKSRA